MPPFFLSFWGGMEIDPNQTKKEQRVTMGGCVQDTVLNMTLVELQGLSFSVPLL